MKTLRKNAFNKQRMREISHEQFVLTYLDKVIVKGMDNHAQHYVDAYKQLGNWQHEILNLEQLNEHAVMAKYIVKPELKPDTPCDVIFIFIDQKCIGMHEVKVDLKGVLNVDADFVRID